MKTIEQALRQIIDLADQGHAEICHWRIREAIQEGREAMASHDERMQWNRDNPESDDDPDKIGY